MKYMLIGCCNRDIETPMYFDTYEKAFWTMCDEISNMVDIDVETIKKCAEKKEEVCDGTFVSHWFAYAEKYGICYDARIFEVNI